MQYNALLQASLLLGVLKGICNQLEIETYSYCVGHFQLLIILNLHCCLQSHAYRDLVCYTVSSIFFIPLECFAQHLLQLKELSYFMVNYRFLPELFPLYLEDLLD